MTLRQRLKGWKTITFNAVCTVFLELSQVPEIQAVLPEGWVKWYALFIAIGNILLRFRTTTPVGRR